MSKAKPARPDSRRAQLRAAQIAEAKRARNKRIAIIAVSAAVAAILITAVVLVAIRFKPDPNKTYPPNANAQRSAIRVHPDKAKQGAPVVTLYADYQCPACASFEKAYGQQLEGLASSGDIQLEYHLMTFLDTNLRNDASNRAANAAACADLAGHYAEYHNTVFANQPADEGRGYSDAQLTTDFPQKAGLSGAALDTFKKCYSDKQYNAFVKGADNSAGEAGVTSTPTLRVNGKTLDTKNLTQDPNSLRTEIMKLK
ncbi:thioredoxin domain-containing protein [Naumannella sp. ID2617S]|uniref:Disulfide bond formation protein DsbA n=1 Tax=Enemella dayhoffiae TaxID=2016507 RepID=A0A255GZ53_9ACTN|nr:thioredoxin domain-containing protein [Enemella dayhoffiae]NNG20382.1 thioredoxin domain-containing protein [Naumannella sp. ID2617S]OYO20965.1 disulfide bond formation protein DsbA [Enemella dayhoffiae]